MSRIGKQPIELPSGVEVRLQGQQVHIKGPKGEISHPLPHGIAVRMEDRRLVVERTAESEKVPALHGLTRTLIQNKILGVTREFEKSLEITGVGYRAQLQGQALQLTLGFSHPVQFPLPAGIEAEVEKQTLIKIRGIDKQLVGQVAANLRALKKPEPYKGKGIKYAGEQIRRKEGKTGK